MHLNKDQFHKYLQYTHIKIGYAKFPHLET